MSNSVITEVCGCGAWTSMSDDVLRVSERLEAFRNGHRCLPAELDSDLETDDAGHTSNNVPVPPPPDPDPQPLATIGTVMSENRTFGFS